MAELTDDIIEGGVSPTPPAPLPKQVSFDVARARKVGYSEGEIAAFLSTKTGFDYTRAREVGYSDKDIINQLAPAGGPPKPAPPPPTEPESGIAKGIAKGVVQEAINVAGRAVTGLGATYQSAATGLEALARKGDKNVRRQIDLMNMVDAGDVRTAMKTAPSDSDRIFVRQYQISSPERRAAVRQGIEADIAALPALKETIAGKTAGIVKGLGEDVSAAGHRIQEWGQKAIPLTPEEEQRTSVKVAKIMTGLTGYLGAAAVGGVPGLIGYGGIEAAGTTYDEAKRAGASDEDAAGAAAISASVQGGLMAVPVSRALGMWRALPGAAAKGEFIKAAATMAESSGTLLAFSQASKLADNIIAKNTYDPKRDIKQGLGEDLGPTAIAGALVPAIPAAGRAAVGAVKRRMRPKPKPSDIIDAPDVDAAIATAREVVESTPADVETIAQQAREFGGEAEQAQAKLLQLFGGLNRGTVEQAPDGSYLFRTGEGDAQQTIPLKVWNERAPAPAVAEGAEPAPTISPQLAAAQRDHYEKMGVKVVYFENDPGIRFDGAVDPRNPDTIFLSNNPERNAAQVGAHEVTHVLESTTLPDGTRLADVLHQQIERGITNEGWRHAYETFGQTAPDRATFPATPEGAAAHADAVVSHLVRELGADIGGEAPRFQTFVLRVIEQVEARYGSDAAKDVLRKLIDGIQAAMRTLREFFARPDEHAEYGQPETVSQNWVTNLGEVHDTLAKMYAVKLGTQAERENVALAAMRERARRERSITAATPIEAPQPAAAPAESVAPPAVATTSPDALTLAPLPREMPTARASREQTPTAPAAEKPPIRATPIREDHAVLASGQQVPVVYAIVSARDLVASQRPDFSANPEYPAHLQPRDRTRSASAIQVQNIANGLNPRMLDHTVHASDGAPIIGPDGVVESGNGRALAIARAYREGLPSAQEYVAYLKGQGYPVEGVEQPVLVRVRSQEMSPDERAAFAREANQRSTMDMSATEQAKSDAASMTGDMLALHRGGDIAGPANRDFVRAFIRDAVGPNDRASMMMADGRLSAQGRRRIESALTSRAYGADNIVSALAEATDNNIKAIGRALTEVAPAWSAMRQEAADGRINAAVDITRDLVDAVNIVRQARDAGRNIAEFVGQRDMFGGTIAPEAEAFLRIMFRGEDFSRPRSAEKIIDALAKYVQQARETSAAPGLFGAQDVIGPREILNAVRSRQSRGEGAAEADLFQRPSGGSESPGVGIEEPGGVGQRPISGEGGAAPGPDGPAGPVETTRFSPREEESRAPRIASTPKMRELILREEWRRNGPELDHDDIPFATWRKEVGKWNEEHGTNIDPENYSFNVPEFDRYFDDTFLKGKKPPFPGVKKANEYFEEYASSNDDAPNRAVYLQGEKRTMYGGEPVFSPKLSGENKTRAYTPEQLKALGDMGAVVDSPTLGDLIRGKTANLPERAIIAGLDRYYGIKADDPAGYVGARLANTAAGATEVFMTEASLKFDGRAYDWKERTGGVQALVKGLGPEAHDFMRWIAGNRAEKLKAEGRENLLSDAAIKALKTLNRGVLAEPYTLSNGKETTSREAAYLDALEKYHALNRNVMDLAVESGLIARKVADELLSDRFYVPFYRVDPTAGEQFVAPHSTTASVKQSAFKKLKGGSEKLNNDLWENAASNWAHLIEASIKNKNTIPILDTAVTQGAAVKLTPQEALHLSDKEQKATTVWVMKNGEKQYYRVEDPGLFAAVSVLEPVSNGPLMKVGRAFKTLLSTGVTMNPAFAVKNIIRDTQQVLATTPASWNVANNLYAGFKENNAPRALENLARSIAGRELKPAEMSDTALSAMASGALMRFGDVVDTGIKQTTIGSLLNTPAGVETFWSGLKTVGNAYRKAMAQSEDVNRIALFKQLKDQGLPHDFAAFSAKDIADFTLTGAAPLVRTAIAMTAFLNPRMQGLYKVGRAAMEGDKSIALAVGTRVGVGIAARVAKVVAAGALVGLALDAIYADDPDAKARTEFDRNSNYWFKIGSTEFRIPKGFEVGALSSLGAIFVESFYDKEMTVGRAFKNLFSILADNLNLNPTPTMIKPLVDVAMNTSGTGNPIVGRGMERLEADQRYTANNTLLARGASTAINSTMRAIPGVSADGPSPIQLDYLVRAYGGWLAESSMQMGDTVARSFASEPVRPESDQLAYYTGGIVSSRPRDASRYVNMLYEQGAAIEKAYNTYRDMLERGQVKEAQDFLKTHQDEIQKHGVVSALMRTEAALNKQIRIVTNNPDPGVTAEQKRLQIQQLVALKNRAAQQVFGASQ